MSWLGPWQPGTLEERIDRLESEAMIRQLPARYARALDARDMAALVKLFPEDVQVGRNRFGRDALFDYMDELMRFARVSVHLIAGHTIDFQDADHATGVVYCADELERPDLGEWQVGRLQYWDTYRRVNGTWYFERRKLHRWYIADALARPSDGAGMAEIPMGDRPLPNAYASWDEFWARAARASGERAGDAVGE